MRFRVTTEVYYSAMTVAELLKQVQLVTATWQKFIDNPSQTMLDKSFVGKVGVDGFRVTRFIWYSNPLQPHIVGQVEPSFDGKNSSLQLKYQVPLFPLIATVLSNIAAISTGIWYFVIRKSIAGPTPYLIGFSLLFFLCIGGVIAFWSEVGYCRRMLKKLLTLEPLGQFSFKLSS